MITNQMAPLQFRRILLAGLAAGLIMNVGEEALHGSILAEATKTAYSALNRNVSPDPVNLVLLVLLTFVQAIVMVWLYTLLRPHLGSKMRTAVCAGLAGWLLSSVYSAVYLSSGFPGILSANLAWMPVAWQLVEYPVAVIVGATAYGK